MGLSARPPTANSASPTSATKSHRCILGRFSAGVCIRIHDWMATNIFEKTLTVDLEYIRFVFGQSMVMSLPLRFQVYMQTKVNRTGNPNATSVAHSRADNLIPREIGILVLTPLPFKANAADMLNEIKHAFSNLHIKFCCLIRHHDIYVACIWKFFFSWPSCCPMQTLMVKCSTMNYDQNEIYWHTSSTEHRQTSAHLRTAK